MRAVLFDLDNTLIDRDKALRHALFEECGETTQTKSLLTLDDHGYGHRKRFLNNWATLANKPKTMQCLSQAICNNLAPDAELLDALTLLAQRCALGIITNGGVENQTAKIAHAGLNRVFSSKHILISGGLPWKKPSAEIFHFGCTTLKIAPSQALFIGDNTILDIKGAKRAGLQTLKVSKAIDAELVHRLLDRCQ